MEKITVLIKKDVLKEVKQMADADERSVGFVIRDLVDKGLNKK
ncbi:hypothetical protein [Paraclostridium sordellii]|nr:hypothetical protein [Paeniclostridium sordellii]EPZ61881.1 hypothetical protein H476_3526 [[Clostridium] sordellii VPI 9048] [Paeniclostridium sordellii VPI 9048]CEN26634.1 Uncharacterised protein [[Clostridium] sordellii] [Paeniclostridium sordellii]